MQIENQSLVSVIIPTQNRLPLLKNALKSVYQQTYKKLEIIVIDAHSTDETAGFLKSEAELHNITVYTSHIALKAGQARNIGIKKATGEFIAFLDDDDEWLPEKLEKQIPLFADAKVGLVYTGARIINVDTNLEYNVSPTIEGDIFEELLIENKIGTTNSVVLRSLIAKELLFDEAFPAREEYDLWLRVAKTYKVAGVTLPLICVYARNTLSRISSNVNNYVSAIDILNEKYKAEIETLSHSKQSLRKAEQLFFLASQSVKANNLSLARNYYFKSLMARFSVKAAGSIAASFFGIKALLLMRKLKG